MSLVYAVRCNFKRSDLEESWNDWYNGPKLAQMLQLPKFLSGQRFRASALNDERKYLALWRVESAEAFQTPEYKSNWGFFDWAPYIGDWSRDLFEVAGRSPVEQFKVEDKDFLYLLSFEGLSQGQANAEFEKIRSLRPQVTWMHAVGLDQHSPILGLRPLSQRDADFEPLPQDSLLKETIFEPISQFAQSSESALS